MAGSYSRAVVDSSGSAADSSTFDDTTTFDDIVRSALVALCGNRPDLLAHAVRAPAPRLPLRPLGVLCGDAAFEHAALGSALFRLRPPGTGLTRAAVRRREPVWVPSIAEVPAFARGSLLGRYGIRSGAAFPVAIGPKLVAVIELLSFDRLEPDPMVEAAAGALTARLAGGGFWEMNEAM